jgi:hypothetical protein
MPMTPMDAIICIELDKLFWRFLNPLLDLRWTFRRMENFRRNVDHASHCGLEYPPTMAYHGSVLGRRPDGTHFYHTVVVDRYYADMPETVQFSYLETVAKHTAAQFDEYLDCSCKVDAPCRRHK